MCTSSEQFIWTRLFSGEFSLMEKYFSNANMILLRKRRIFHWINQEMKPKYPVHACVNIQIKGYDFPVLESYQRFLHRTAQSLDLDVTDRYEVYWLFHSKKSLFNIKHYSTVFFSWATPPQHMFVTKLKPQSTTVDGEFNLKIYERNIQVKLICCI